MFLGRNPGHNEDAQNRPFVGRAGQLLRNVAHAAGLSDEDILYTNVVKCLTPENRPPTTEEQLACRPYLEEELATQNPRFVFAFGAEAIAFWTGKIPKSVLALQGERWEIDGRYVFPMPHPSWVLRQGGPPDRPSAAEREFQGQIQAHLAFIRNMQNGDGGATPGGRPRVVLCRTMADVTAALDDLERCERIAVDTETQGLWWAPDNCTDPKDRRLLHTIQLSGDGEMAYVIPFQHPETPAEISENREFIRDRLSKLLSKKTIMQRAQFDLNWLRSRDIECRAGFDTRIVAHLLDENLDAGLKRQIRQYLGYIDDYALDMSKSESVICPLEELAVYGGIDAALTWRLGAYHRPRLLAEPRLARLYTKLLQPGIEMLARIEANGIGVDWDYLKELETNKETEVAKIDATLVEAMPPCPAFPDDDAPARWNWDAAADVGELLFCGLGLPVRQRTPKTGVASVGDEVLQDLLLELPVGDDRRGVVEALRGRSEIRKQQGYFASWRKLRRHDGRIHPTYHWDVTVTGRTSSREPSGQQVPRDTGIRQCFVPRPGWKLLEIDYSQIELRLIAEESQDPTMMAVLTHPEGDIHRTTAAAVLGKSPAEVTDAERQKGKSINFGYSFGMFPKRFQYYSRYEYGISITLEEAESFRRAYFDLYTRLEPWHERRKQEVRETGQVVSMFGRVRRPSGIYSKNQGERMEAERQAINFGPQSGASDLAIFACCQVDIIEDEIIPIQFGHDSFLFEVRSDKVSYWATKLKETFEGIHLPLREQLGINLSVPLFVDIKVGDDWGFGG